MHYIATNAMQLSIGTCCIRLGDEAEAVRCYQDAHRMFPANMDVISWLGAFHVKNEVQYFFFVTTVFNAKGNVLASNRLY